jgi:hypothetical protein
MATTPNFNWSTPDNTGLVKNGALDIRTLGNSIDASMADLKGGTTGQVLAKATNTDMDFTWVAQDDSNAIQNSIVDAKGDLIAATANDTPARLAVGANDTVLTADSSTATGLKWATPAAGGGITLLSTTTLSGSSTTISSISGSYTNLYFVYHSIQTSGDNAELWLRLNSDTGSNYDSVIVGSANNAFTSISNNGNTFAVIGKTTADGGNAYKAYGELTINNYTSTSTRVMNGTNGMRRSTNADQYGLLATAQYRGSSAITSITFLLNTGTFSTGTVLLYGVK